MRVWAWGGPQGYFKPDGEAAQAAADEMRDNRAKLGRRRKGTGGGPTSRYTSKRRGLTSLSPHLPGDWITEGEMGGHHITEPPWGPCTPCNWVGKDDINRLTEKYKQAGRLQL